MNLENKKLIIDPKSDNNQLNALSQEILLNIDEIDLIEIDYKQGIESSALFALLYSIKNKKASVSIPMIDDLVSIDGMGKVLFIR